MVVWSSLLSAVCVYESIFWCLSNDCFIRNRTGEIFARKILQARLEDFVLALIFMQMTIFNSPYVSERNVYFRYYWTLIGVCWMVAVIFATPPLFGYGIYSCDATGTVCALLWPSLSSGARQLGYSVPYVIVCGIIPVIGMWVLIKYCLLTFSCLLLILLMKQLCLYAANIRQDKLLLKHYINIYIIVVVILMVFWIRFNINTHTCFQ